MGPSTASLESRPRKSTEDEQMRVSPGQDPKTGSERAQAFHVTSKLRRAHTVAQGRHTGGKETNIGSKVTRERTALSLLRTKDSHELLQKRSVKHLDVQKPPRDTYTGAKESSHFTVGNVGHNGKIFLRPVRNLSLKEPRRTAASSSANQSKTNFLRAQEHGRYGGDGPSRWSNSQLSELRPEVGGNRDDAASIDSELSRSESHYRPHQFTLQRSRSFSTISEQRSASRAGGNREFRVIIDRPDDRPRSAGGSLHLALDVSIPSCQLDITQFNAADHGLQSSTNSAEAWNYSIAPIAYLDDPARPSLAPSILSGVSAMDLSRSAAVSPDPVLYDPGDSIKPSIFETLVTVMDDESVVRYVPGTKNISAATPARIVAQISSESFMDYELVSDFFLTFRPYLSTGSLLSLLLARLQWAINRLQEDGRIIRIRTFAALRHWILNYFVDDFVPDLKLRVHFCETVNRLYDNVKARQGGGMSDLKILIDLKRCWHGKCSTYWDLPDQHLPYNNPDRPIDPGGEEPFIGDDLPNVVLTQNSQAPGSGEARSQPSLTHHDRIGSSATAKSMPESAGSDWSAPAISCSLPARPPKRHSMPFSPANAPHPVPVISRQVGASEDTASPVSLFSSRRYPFYGHAHKRSGSFSDSVRDDRAPLPVLKLDNKSSSSSQEPCYLGGLIRGELYPPAESYMTMMAPPSPPLPSGTCNMMMGRRDTADRLAKPASSGSGVKTIIGSIRRALNGKHAGHSVSARPTNAPSTKGKTSALPTNVAFRSDLYRDKKAISPVRNPARIDLLGDEVLQQYRQAFGEHIDLRADNEEAQRQHYHVPDQGPTSFFVSDNGRAQSSLTGGSESIVIVDGTGIRAPEMSGAIGMAATGLGQPPRFLTGESSPATPRAHTFLSSSRGSTPGADEYSLPIYYDGASARRSRRFSTLLGDRTSAAGRSLSVERGSSSWRKPSSSLGLRKYASFQSGVSRHRLARGSESGVSVAESSVQDRSDKPAGPTLRRRPGGDLRQMRNGSGTRSYPGSASIWSDIASQSSVADSADPASRRQTSLVPPNPRFSLLQTHSSQHMRRSFEAAIARFAQIPDDDDGGIESALLKLEGKWKAPASAEPEDAENGFRQILEPCHTQRCVRASSPARSRRGLGENLTYAHAQARNYGHRPYSESIMDSEDSYNSIPLLERGLSDESMKKPMTDQAPQHYAAEALNAPNRVSDLGSSHPSIDMVKKTESLRRIPRGSTLPVKNQTDSKGRPTRLSGLSSELSVDMIDAKEAAESRLSLDTRSLSESSLGIPPHPLAHPPSPPMTIQNPRSAHSYRTSLNQILAKAQPLTPDPSPINNASKRANIPSVDMQHVSGDIFSRPDRDRHHPGLSKARVPQHVPFILSCESQILAQQFTLVEMAALGEVDWRDLVDMKWNSSPPFTTSWVQFLVEEERRGIDLVVGRFNLMVKWVLSEIVLTQDIHERARTVAKFIHTAAHARRICNYATMLQIAIALSSTDCSRLQSTWALVSPEDRRVLRDMELLIQPVRNFHDLRVEMETANVQEGCIPFVGLYIHDLTYNAQKPAQVAATRDGEPLINFERYRTTARIVKSLLRLIDASTKYKFEPLPGIIERVLWIASLSEEQIQTRSKQLI